MQCGRRRASFHVILARLIATVGGQNSATPRLFDTFLVDALLGRFRPIWASRGVGMVIVELGMLSTVCWFEFQPEGRSVTVFFHLL